MVALVLTLAVIGVLLWCLNRFGGPYIDGMILKIINVVVVICVVLYVLNAFGILPITHDIPVPKIR
jgi:hypothetical protein